MIPNPLHLRKWAAPLSANTSSLLSRKSGDRTKHPQDLFPADFGIGLGLHKTLDGILKP